ncbi:MAG: reverse transcriptase-like protein, partial [Actinobacteria bacterium]|nr:reverse transcriptase-like protein [Actinomycetota bacterium]
QTRSLLGRFQSFRVDHIPRAKNTQADALANAAMDAKGMVGNASAQMGVRGAIRAPREPDSC